MDRQINKQAADCSVQLPTGSKQEIIDNKQQEEASANRQASSALARKSPYYNPLYKRGGKVEENSHAPVRPIREEARDYQKSSRQELLRMQNRGKGDTAVSTMLYTSLRLFKICKRVLKRPVTPKVIYDFRYAKMEFEKAKLMRIAGASKLFISPEEEEIVRLKKWDEEEEEIKKIDLLSE